MRFGVACVLVVVLALPSSMVRALDPSVAPTQYVHQMWTEVDGLPQNAALAIAHTSDGFIWVGTEEGIARFDGRRFEVWNKSSHPMLDSSAVRAVYAAPDNTVWFGTYDGVLCAIRHRVVETCYGADAGLPRDFVRAIQVASDGRLWVATSAGLYVQQGSRFEQAVAGRAMGLARQGTHILAATDNGLWDGVGTRATQIAFAGQLLTSIYVAPNGRTFVGLTEGVFEMHGAMATPIASTLAQHLTVRGIALDRDGNLWLGAANGIFRCRGAECVGTHRSQVVYAVHVDADGAVWYGNAFEGLHVLHNPTVVSIGAEEGFVTGPTGSAAVAEDGTVWVATHGHGVVHARLVGTTLQTIREWRASDGLPTDDVDGVAIDADGIVWAASTRGFAAIDNEAMFVPPPEEQAPGVSWHIVTRRQSDSHVFGWALGRGIVAMHGHSLQWYPEAAGVGAGAVRGFHAEGDGSFWIGMSTELLRIGGDATTPQVLNRFPVGSALSFYEDEELGLIIGTMSHGLALRSGDQFRTFGRESGMASDLLFSLEMDAQRGLWGAFNGGLVHISREDLRALRRGDLHGAPFPRVGIPEGLRAGECNGGEPGRFSNGWLLFPTVEGVALIRANVAAQAPPHPLVVDEVRVDDAVVAFGTRARLFPGEHELRVRFTAPMFSHSDEIRIRTRLRGIESGWRDVGESREVRFSRLPPGEQTLEAEAWFRGRQVGRQSLVLQFSVLPHWSQTWWFRSAIALALLLVLLVAYKTRTSVLKGRARALEQMVRERTSQLEERTLSLDHALTELKEAQAEVIRAEREASVATLVQGVAHELNNPINFLAANVAPLRSYAAHLARITKELSDGRVRTAEELATLTRFSPKKDLDFVLQDLDAVVRDVDEGARRAKIIVADLQNLKSSTSRSLVHVDVQKAIEQTLRLAAPRISSTHRVHTKAESGLVVTSRAGHVEQVLANIIDNALRAMPDGGDLTVEAARKDAEIELLVTDTGVGMDEATRSRCTEPFFTTRDAGSGTGLGLSLVASMIAAADGTLAIESDVGKGTRIRVRWPAAQK